MKRKIFLTGGSGFIGSNLKAALGGQYNVYAPTSRAVDLTDTAAVEMYLRTHRFDAIIHTAYYTPIRVNPAEEMHQNLTMYFNLSRFQHLFGRLFCIGSGAEYGRESMHPMMKEEEFQTNIPRDTYGFTKYTISAAAAQSPNIYILRLFGCFGKYENWRNRFFPNTIYRARFGIDIVIRQKIFFDYLYVNDFAEILRTFIEAKRIPHKQFNVCTGAPIDVTDIARRIIEASGNTRVRVRAKKRGYGREYSGDNSRLLSFIPTLQFTPLEAAIPELYAWYSGRAKQVTKRILRKDY